MQKTDLTPGCSCSTVGLAWNSFEFLSKDMLVRYEMGAGVSVWAAYKPEGFSMFGRGIVEDCGQNSPPSGLIQKLETLLKLMFLFLRLSWIATFVFLVTSKIFILQFLAGLSILAWIRSIVSDPVSIIVHCPLGSSCLWQAMFFVVMFLNAFRKNAICCSPASPSSPSAQRFTGGDCQCAWWPKIFILSRVTECFSRVVL